MSIKLMAQAAEKLTSEGFNCTISAYPSNANTFFVCKNGTVTLHFDNYIDHDQEGFEHRLTLLAENGLKGRWYGISR